MEHKFHDTHTRTRTHVGDKTFRRRLSATRAIYVAKLCYDVENILLGRYKKHTERVFAWNAHTHTEFRKYAHSKHAYSTLRSTRVGTLFVRWLADMVLDSTARHITSIAKYICWRCMCEFAGFQLVARVFRYSHVLSTSHHLYLLTI